VVWWCDDDTRREAARESVAVAQRASEMVGTKALPTIAIATGSLRCRLLPGWEPDEFLEELEHALGRALDAEVIRFDGGPEQPDMGLFETLAAVVEDGEPEAHAVPFLMPASTDGRFFAKLGSQSYGFLPMPLGDLDFASMIHGSDERIPVDASRVRRKLPVRPAPPLRERLGSGDSLLRRRRGQKPRSKTGTRPRGGQGLVSLTGGERFRPWGRLTAAHSSSRSQTRSPSPSPPPPNFSL